MSAIADTNDQNLVVNVLFALHEGFDTLDFTGPLEVFDHAKHDMKKPETKAFKTFTAAVDEKAKSAQGITIKADMDFEEATDRLDEFDLLVIVGGNSDETLKKAEPISLIKAWAELQEKDPSKERTLFSVCTGALFLAKAGVLQGFAATTHPDYYTKLEILCHEAARDDLGERTDVMEERYVVNNARFDIGDNVNENPFILSKRPDGRRASIARKGSFSFKNARRRESLVRRGALPLGGLRVITAGGVAAGMDASLYLVAALVSHETALEVARYIQFTWTKGVTVEGVDV
jgi:putative intracellular protease/amidase